ncbi:PLD nuclease N-terminal domain-containing protein [Microbacterium murale]|uniref:Cardiolipin synthase N-terminal domain-containing protein n=1 Tax=Microbacterium murale TaxID=1081040 RepID=A0ABQ1RS24_9MICO|nr:PLD nuclease N-terminal domain-containing protein [Microbacterium murale]GGD76871.1 hypothetical protein GCM10007269_19740 [Microbacterium murale]
MFEIYPMDALWSLAGVPLILGLAIVALVQIHRSSHSAGTKILWSITVIVLPVVGSLVWFVFGTRRAAERAAD